MSSLLLAQLRVVDSTVVLAGASVTSVPKRKDRRFSMIRNESYKTVDNFSVLIEISV